VLGETLVLWARHWKFFVLLGLFLEFPSFLPGRSRHDDFTALNVCKGAIAFVLPIIFHAMGMAAALSLLRNQSGEKNWFAIARGIHHYTGQLVGVQVLLTVLVLLIFIPIGGVCLLLRTAFELSAFWLLLPFLICPVLLKYALADPLVVAENLKAGSALKVSWGMTRSHFGFVLGCYLIVAVFEWLINYGTGYLTALARLSLREWILPLLLLSVQIAKTYSYVLPWIMYVRIKIANGDEIAEVDPV
jgi:hypothetical protein